MRLICPNCKAQYNVDEALIPEEGRDVQCATCKKTWFQEKTFAATPLKLTTPVSPPRNRSHEDRVGHSGPSGPTGPAAPRRTMGGTTTAPKPEPEAAPAPPPPVNDDIDRDELRRAVEEELAVKASLGATEEAYEEEKDEDTDLLKSLREQLAEAGTDFETGPASGSRKRSVVKAAESAGITQDELLADRSRKVLPSDISLEFVEELNETRPKERRVGGGFILALILVGIAAGTYFFKSTIADAYPPAEPYLDQYTDAVDSARSGVESMAAMVTELVANRDTPVEDPAAEAEKSE
jgi:predicted Zn finger-like uncharacterized protein